MPKEKHQCDEKYYHGHRAQRCPNNAKVERDGKWYCGIHDPVARRAKSKARFVEWDTKQKAINKVREENTRRGEAEEAACEGISTDALESGAIRELVEAVDGAILGFETLDEQFLPKLEDKKLKHVHLVAMTIVRDLKAALAKLE